MKISIAILIIVLTVLVWHLKVEDKKRKTEAVVQAEFVPTQQSVNGEWVDMAVIKEFN